VDIDLNSLQVSLDEVATLVDMGVDRSTLNPAPTTHSVNSVAVDVANVAQRRIPRCAARPPVHIDPNIPQSWRRTQ
jgi:hypothetical protein